MGKIYNQLLYQSRISLKIDGEIKSSSDKKKLREFNTTKPALQQMLYQLIQSRNTREGERSPKSTPNNQKNGSRNIYISIITLNVNGLNAKTKIHRLAEWIQKQDPYICCLQETHFRPKETYRLKVRGQKNTFRANGKQKKAGLAIPMPEKINFKIKKITRDKEGQYITIKGSIQEEDITIVNIYAPNIGAPQYIRQT